MDGDVGSSITVDYERELAQLDEQDTVRCGP